MDKMMLKKQYMMYSPKKKISRLPSEYQEVEYIESTGTQYIDTGVKATNTTKFKIDVELVSYDSYIFGAWNDWQVSMFTIYSANESSSAIGYGANWVGSIKGITTNNKITLSIDNGVIKYNDEIKGTYSDTFNSTNNIILCGTNAAGTPTALSKIKIYSLEIDGHRYIPCYRKSDNEVGLYDIVGKQFYTNSGSGTFQYGREIIRDSISGFKQLDYIETSGTQYINTNHIFTSDNQKLETQVKFISTKAGRWAGVFKFNVGNAISIATNGNKLWFGRNGDYYTTTTYNDGDLLNIKAIAINQNITGYVNEQEVLNTSYSLNKSSYTPPYKYYLFAQNYGDNNNSPWGMGKSIMYYFRLYENDVIIRNFIPMERTSDGELGMYDLVTNTFFTNQGSGKFIKGGYVE